MAIALIHSTRFWYGRPPAHLQPLPEGFRLIANDYDWLMVRDLKTRREYFAGLDNGKVVALTPVHFGESQLYGTRMADTDHTLLTEHGWPGAI